MWPRTKSVSSTKVLTLAPILVLASVASLPTPARAAIEGLGEVVETPERARVDAVSFVSPPWIAGPVVDCLPSVTVQGVRRDALVRLFVDFEEIARDSVKEGSSVRFLLDGALRKGARITATQVYGEAASSHSDPIFVEEFEDAYPDGLPRPQFHPSPIYACGRFCRVVDVPEGAHVLLFDAETGDTVSMDVATRWGGILYNKLDGQWITDWESGGEYYAVSTGCGKTSEPSAPIPVRSYPQDQLPTVNPDSVFAFEENDAVSVPTRYFVNSAEVRITDEQNENLESRYVLAGGEWQTFRLNRVLQPGESVVLQQELCPGTSSDPVTVVVRNCSEIPHATIQNPKPGDIYAFVVDALPEANIRIHSSLDGEIGDGSGARVKLDRPLEEGEILTVIQDVNGCVGDFSYQVDVRRANHVVLIVIDGLSPEILRDYEEHLAPEDGGFSLLRQRRGTLTGCDSQGVFPSLTMTNMSSLATGLVPAKTKVHGNRYYYRHSNRFTDDPHSGTEEKIEWSGPDLAAATYGFYDPFSKADPYSILSAGGYEFDAGEASNGVQNGSQGTAAGDGALDRYLAAHGCTTIYERLREAGFSSFVVNHQISKGAGHPIDTTSPVIPHISDGWSIPNAQATAAGQFPAGDALAFFENFDATGVMNLVGSDEREGLISEWKRHKLGLPNLLTVYFASFDHVEHNTGVTRDLSDPNLDIDILSYIDEGIRRIYLSMIRNFREETEAATFIVVSDHSLRNTFGGTHANDYADLKMITRGDIHTWNGAFDAAPPDWPQLLNTTGGPKITFGAGTAHLYGHYRKSTARKLVWWLGRHGKVAFGIHRPSVETQAVSRYWKPDGTVEVLVAPEGRKDQPLQVLDPASIEYLGLGDLIAESIDEETFPDLLLVSSSRNQWRFGSSKPAPFTFEDFLLDMGVPSWLLSILPGDLGFRIAIMDELPKYGEHGWLSTTRNVCQIHSAFLTRDSMVSGLRIFDIAPTICSLLGVGTDGMDGQPILEADFAIVESRDRGGCSGIRRITDTTRDDLLRNAVILESVGERSRGPWVTGGDDFVD